MTKRKQHINLMMSKSYCPEWNGWHVLREMRQNCLDADPDNTIEFPDDDNVIMTTATSPTLSQLLMIGEGTKAGNKDMIGEFGEGSKLACLVAARSRMGLTIEVPEGTWTFSLKTAKGFDCQSLHATLDPNSAYKGCRIKFKSKGVKQLFEKNFTDEPYGPMKDNRLFVKGIYICDLEEKALMGWNAEHVTLNRDRSIPDQFALKSELGRLALTHTNKNDDFIDEIFNNIDCFEIECLSWRFPSDLTKKKFADGFTRVFGEKAIVASKDQKKNAVAVVKGYTPITLPINFDKYIPTIESVDKILDKQDNYIFVSKEAHYHSLEEIYNLMKMLNCKSKLEIFEDGTGNLGFYDFKNKTIGICESQFKPGKREARLGTILHEYAHELSLADDQTLEFGAALTVVAGLMAGKALEGYTEF